MHMFVFLGLPPRLRLTMIPNFVFVVFVFVFVVNFLIALHFCSILTIEKPIIMHGLIVFFVKRLSTEMKLF